MSLRNKLFSIAALGTGVLVFSTASFAQDDKATTAPAAPQKAERPFKKGDHGDHQFKREGFHGRGMGRGEMGAGFRGINLTDEQKAQLKQIREANKPDKAAFDKLKTIREARKNGTAITSEQKQQLKSFREQALAKAKATHEQMLSVLTADQKAQLEKERGEMKTRRDGMRKKFEDRRQNRTNKPTAIDSPKTN